MRQYQLLRSSNTHTDLQSELPEGAAPQIHVAITKTAEAYQEASHFSPTSTSAVYHARFLLSLVRADIERTRQAPVKEVPIDPNIQQSKCSLRDARNLLTTGYQTRMLRPLRVHPMHLHIHHLLPHWCTLGMRRRIPLT